MQARQEMGDGEDPEFNWVIGKAGDLLDYKLVGMHKVISGNTSVCDQSAYNRLTGGGAAQEESADGENFLMVGRLPNCSSASVYVLKSGEGLMIASNYENIDD